MPDITVMVLCWCVHTPTHQGVVPRKALETHTFALRLKGYYVYIFNPYRT